MEESCLVMVNKQNVAESAMGSGVYELAKWAIRFVVPSVVPMILCFTTWIRTAPFLIVLGMLTCVFLFTLFWFLESCWEKRFRKRPADNNRTLVVPIGYKELPQKALTRTESVTLWIIGGASLVGMVIFYNLHHVPTKIDNAQKPMPIITGNEPKRISWLLPEIDEDHPYIVFFGGHYQKKSEFGSPMIYGGSRAVVDSFQMGRKQGASVIISNGQYTVWPAMVARSIGGRACIDVHVSGSRAPIEIENGESTPLPEYWDWNSDTTAMEIVDDQTRVVFQEEFIPTNQVILRGDIQYENTMIDAGDYGWPTTKPHIMVGDTGLRPLFLYPSERHPAKRNPNYTP
jgi:hypothetical protein